MKLRKGLMCLQTYGVSLSLCDMLAEGLACYAASEALNEVDDPDDDVCSD